MEIKNILSELDLWNKNQDKLIMELEYKLAIAKEDKKSVHTLLVDLIGTQQPAISTESKESEDQNGTTIGQ
jgi:hypothetical protein